MTQDRYAVPIPANPGISKAAREPRNLTPTFMTFAIAAWRRSYKISWAAYRTADAIKCDVTAVYDRPKTPGYANYKERNTQARRWMANFFRPVSDALFDGCTDAEALRIWRNTERHEVKDYAVKDIGGYYQAVIKPKTRIVIKARELDKKHDWNTVK